MDNEEYYWAQLNQHSVVDNKQSVDSSDGLWQKKDSGQWVKRSLQRCPTCNVIFDGLSSCDNCEESCPPKGCREFQRCPRCDLLPATSEEDAPVVEYFEFVLRGRK